jgi:sugar diacid utilization regulator
VIDLQGLVDGLASELGRPVGLDDRQFRSLAYSSHVEELDRVRLSSILQREAPKAVTEYLTSLGIDEVDDHIRIPANPRLGMVARVCLPVRFDGTLLGYTWLFDEPAPLSAHEIVLARRFADDAAAVLFRQRQLESADRNRERELLGQLLGLRHGDRREAADGLLGNGLVARASELYIVVVRAMSAAGAAPDDRVRVRLAAAVDRLRRAAAPHQVLALSSGDEVVVLLALDGPTMLDRKLQLLESYLADTLADEAHWSPIVGVSATHDSLGRAAAAYEQARAAAHVAAIDVDRRPVARWDLLGAHRTILSLLRSADPRGCIPPAVVALTEAPDAEQLVATVLAWLDHGADARAAAEALHVHRSSLYNRLRRVEAVAGVDLHSGDDRLELHLGLRLWQLAGGTITDLAAPKRPG